MRLVPVERESGTEGEDEGMDMSGMPEGLAHVKVSPERQHLIGVTKETVSRRELRLRIRTVGVVDADETKVADIHSKIQGWIDELYVDYTGKMVRKGDPLLSIYSPELVSTQEEYLLALEAADKYKDSPFPEIVESGEKLVTSARRRLELWDIPDDEIEELERTRVPKKTLTLRSPITGYVTEKHALEGMYVSPQMRLFRITDLSRVWVHADLYEYELQYVSVGQKATFELSYFPGETFEGIVTYVYPYLEEKTRTAKVRLEFPNPGYRLKPGMYANVEMFAELGEHLAVPEEAVLNTGERAVVYVAVDEASFEPREVVLGPKAGDYWAVLEGLREGEMVVTSANFLIDSESRLRAAVAATAGAGHAH